MTQIGGYFEAENSMIVQTDNKSKYKLVIKRLRDANVIEQPSNRFNFNSFVNFISNIANHTKANGERKTVDEDFFSLENLINAIYTFYNPLLNIDTIVNPNYILLDENNRYIHSPILERNPINTARPILDNQGAIIPIYKYRLTNGFRLEKIQLPSREIIARIAARNNIAPRNPGNNDLTLDYDESHHLYEDYMHDINMKSTFVNVISTGFGDINNQTYQQMSIQDIIRLKLMESNVLLEDKFLQKIRNTHEQKVLGELFNQI